MADAQAPSIDAINALEGVFVAFSFGPGAEREIKRAEREDGLQVVPLTVSDLLAFERAA